AAGTHSINNAARLIASGRSDLVLAGGSEAAMTPTGIAAFRNMTALSTSGISRPFDTGRDGFVIAEGAGVLVLDALEAARAAAAVALSMQHRQIPRTANTVTVDPEIHIDVVTGGPRDWEPGPTLSNSFGFGGHNGCFVIIPA